jgi:hypothetical protein
MGAPRHREQMRRRVAVGDAELAQVRDDGACIGEAKLAVELQPVRADGNAKHGLQNREYRRQETVGDFVSRI